MVVPIEKVRVKVGCVSMGVTSLKGDTGLGPATNSFTSAGPRTVVKGFIIASCDMKTDFISALLSAFLVPFCPPRCCSESAGGAGFERKTDKLGIHTQFHVAFAPSFNPKKLPVAPQQ